MLMIMQGTSIRLCREWSLFLFNILIFLYTFIAFMRTWKHYRRWVFELVPLSVNTAATFVLLILKLFEKGYEFDEIGHLIEIFTYFLFCYTFAIMYARANDESSSKSVERAWNILLAVLMFLLVTACVLVFVGIISHKCSQQN